jgi:hypothetical protein
MQKVISLGIRYPVLPNLLNYFGRNILKSFFARLWRFSLIEEIFGRNATCPHRNELNKHKKVYAWWWFLSLQLDILRGTAFHYISAYNYWRIELASWWITKVYKLFRHFNRLERQTTGGSENTHHIGYPWVILARLAIARHPRHDAFCPLNEINASEKVVFVLSKLFPQLTTSLLLLWLDMPTSMGCTCWNAQTSYSAGKNTSYYY